MPITNPDQLVDEFKKSGEFDRLRREMLSEFRNGEDIAAFMARVEDITKQKLASDQKLQYMPEVMATRELMQELDRYPIVERAVADVRSLSDPAFGAGIRDSVRKILDNDRKGISASDGTPSHSRQNSDRKSGLSLPPTPSFTGESPRRFPASPLPPTPTLAGESPRVAARSDSPHKTGNPNGDPAISRTEDKDGSDQTMTTHSLA